MSKTTFIYALTCPDTDEIRYVGKADNPQARLKYHIKRYEPRPTHKSNWIKSLLSSGKRPGIVILEEVALSEWERAERRWIEYHRATGARLTNTTDGGLGGSGRKRLESGKKFSISLSDEAIKLLGEIAESWGISKSAALEMMIRDKARALALR